MFNVHVNEEVLTIRHRILVIPIIVTVHFEFIRQRKLFFLFPIASLLFIFILFLEYILFP